MLDDDGFLPPGRRRVTIQELHQVFVADFPTSKNRQALFEAWASHRGELQSIISMHSQWIGGSFVSSKVDPGDIDVVTLVSGEDYDQLSSGRQSLADKLMAGDRTKLIYGIDSYALSMYPEGHPEHDDYLRYRGYWDRWLGRFKDDETGERGYLEVAA